MSTSEFPLPDVGEGLTEAEIVSWRVKVGDTIEVNQVIVEIETAKSLVELPSPFAGVVTGLLVEEGQNVQVGTPIIAVSSGAPEASQEAAVQVGSTPAAEAQAAVAETVADTAASV
ncbi:MAG TPA: biotin/lipoyl-containing protein, partial [Terrimesophilobacter sp.]|uniref:biotin/lipoyl-containing protein n=1 Tax=Terrimesophilobacter sp. TaxID=2906435 RepID=UPI002F95D169